MDDKEKEGESKAERENSNPVFRGLPFGNKEEGSGPDSVHGLSLPLTTRMVPFWFSPMPYDSNRGHSSVVSVYCDPPPTRTALYSSLGSLNLHYNLHLRKTESQSKRSMLRAAELGQTLALWPLDGVLLGAPQPLLF